MFKLTNINYKPLRTVPELLEEGRYIESIELSKIVLKSVLDEPFTNTFAWYFIGLLYLYYIYKEKSLKEEDAKLYNKRAIHFISEACKRDNYPSLQEGYFGIEIIKTHNIVLLNNANTITPSSCETINIISPESILSNIYLIVSRLYFENDNEDIATIYLKKSLEYDKTNLAAFWYLLDLYHESKMDEDEYQLLDQYSHEMPENESIIDKLWPLLYNKREYYKAGEILSTFIERRKVLYVNTINKLSQSEKNNTERDIYKYQIIMHIMFFLSYLKDNKYNEAFNEYAGAFASLDLKTEKGYEKLNIDCSIRSLFIRCCDVLDVDNKVILKYNSLGDIFNYILFLHKQTHDLVKYIQYLANTELYLCILVIVAKHIYSVALLFSLGYKYQPDSSKLLKEYINDLSEIIFLQLSNSINTFQDVIWDKQIGRYLEEISHNKGINENDIILLFEEICCLIRHIYKKYGINGHIKSVNALENFIINIIQCKDIKQNEDMLLKTLKEHILEYGHGKNISNLEKQYERIISDLKNIPVLTAKEVIEKQRREQTDKKDNIELKIDFSKDKTIWVNGKPFPIKKSQEYLLLEEVLVSEWVHSSYGFYLSRDWQKNVPVNGPIDQFGVIAGRLNTILGVPIVIASKGTKNKTWKINPSMLITENTISKSIEILNDINMKEYGDNILDKILLSLSFYPESIQANILAIDYYQHYSRDINVKTKNKINEVVMLLWDKESRLCSAINKIQEEGEKNNWEGYWKEASNYYKKMTDQYNEIIKWRFNAENLFNNIIMKPDDEKYHRLMRIIREIKRMRTMKYDDNKMVQTLMEDITIVECRDKAIGRFLKKYQRIIQKGVNPKDIEKYYANAFYEVLEKGKFAVKDLEELKNYLIKSLYYKFIDCYKAEKNLSDISEDDYRKIIQNEY